MATFSDRMFPETVVFGLAVSTPDDRGGSRTTYTDGAPVKARVETIVNMTKITEPADAKPISRTHYRIFTKVDPSAGRGRTLQINDRGTWADRNITLQLVSSPNPQDSLWLIEAERVT